MRIDNPSIITNDGDLNTGIRRNITKVTQSGWNENLLIADGRLFCFKSGHGNINYTASMSSIGYAPNTFRRGIDQMWEIVFPTTETGNIVDADTYGTSAWALFDSGNLYTWGRNTDGQLGVGDTTDRYVPTLSATNVSKVYSHHSQDQRSTRYQRLFHLKTNGKLYGCGYNNWYQLGDGTTTTRNSWLEITAAGLNPKSVWNIGGYTGCLIVQKSDNNILICGYNGYGQLGNNTTNSVTTLTNLSTAWNGGDNTMVIQDVWFMNSYFNGTTYEDTALGMFLDNGTTSRIVGCGYNQYATLGDGTSTNRTTPVTPTVLTGRVQKVIKTGDYLANIFVLKTDGTLWNWGYNAAGQLGRGDNAQKYTPAQVMTGVEMIYDHMIAGADYAYRTQSAVVKKLDGTYWIAGYGSFGQMANGTYTDVNNTFAQMRFPKGTVIKHFGGSNSTTHGDMHYVVTQNNEIYAYGYNQLYAISVTNADDYALPLLVQPPVLLR